MSTAQHLEVTRALQYAEVAHGTQMYGDRPYIQHLRETVAVAQRYTEDWQTLQAAALHDVLEDTAVTFGELRESFGWTVAEAVRAVTDPPGKNRKERKAKLYGAGISNTRAAIVKLADRIANVTACVSDGNARLLRMYQHEHPAFKNAIIRNNHGEDTVNIGVMFMELEEALAGNLITP